jgi:hypothetical protein
MQQEELPVTTVHTDKGIPQKLNLWMEPQQFQQQS